MPGAHLTVLAGPTVPVPLPMVPGHEFAGVVSEVGRLVKGFAVGDRVTAPFVNGCGRCTWCRDGHAQVCPDQEQPGFTRLGSFAERVVVTAAESEPKLGSVMAMAAHTLPHLDSCSLVATAEIAALPRPW